MANEQNLIPFRNENEAREAGKKGGVKSGETRRRKRDLKQRMKALMQMDADPKIAAAMEKAGVPVKDNLDVMMAAIYKGALKGDPRMVDKALELADQDAAAKARKAKEKAELERLQLENERLKLENEKMRMWLDAINGTEEIEDDGFLEALKDAAAEDWDEADI